jgi:soluble lytic murein transglycosylase-like protein
MIADDQFENDEFYDENGEEAELFYYDDAGEASEEYAKPPAVQTEFEFTLLPLEPGFIVKVVLAAAFLVGGILFLAALNMPSEVAVQGSNSIDQAGGQSISNNKQANSSNSQASSATTNDECQVSNFFPENILQWCSLITRYASKHGLPPDLVAAIMWQESGGDPQAYSHSGAVGLMQVMPSDGQSASFMCASGPCFRDRPTISELKDPEFNINYGTKMLADLVRRYGNVRDALKSYGPMDMGYYYADKVLGIFQQYGRATP